jgi:hypothetical protein
MPPGPVPRGATKKPAHSRIVEEPLVAAIHGRAHTLALRGLIPVRGRSDSARMGRESHQKRPATVLLADALSEIELADIAYIRCARISEV